MCMYVCCRVKDMPQLNQMGGRSCRTRGACYCTYFLNTDEDKEQVRLRLTKTIASELNLLAELNQLFRKINSCHNNELVKCS